MTIWKNNDIDKRFNDALSATSTSKPPQIVSFNVTSYVLKNAPQPLKGNLPIQSSMYLPAISYVFCLICLLFTQFATALEKDEYPGRRLYPGVDFIELENFHDKLVNDQVILIDVRSTFEYDTLHISKAKNIPLSSATFVERVKAIREADARPIVTYCNGKTCMKSFKAARRLLDDHVDNVLVFDSGIMDFARAYPKLSLLLGKPLNSASKLISQQKFSQHLINPDKFGNHIAKTNAILLDIRDRVQREDGISLFAGREHRVTLDSARLNRYIERAKKNDQGLLIYDAAGKQVRWLQYRLEDSGVKNYFFMAGGADAYYHYLESK